MPKPQPSGSGNRSGQQLAGYLSQDTICALATAMGGPVVILRVSGPDSENVLEKTCLLKKMDLAGARKLVLRKILDFEGKLLDEGLVSYFLGPESLTGEDCIEFHLHGSIAVVTDLVRTLAKLGVRQALPGEFSFRAVRNGKVSITQAEAVSDLISSSNRQASELALEKMQGAQNRGLMALSEELKQAIVLGELGIDFSDQDIDEVSVVALRKKLKDLAGKLERLCAGYDRGSKLQNGVVVAFVGLPNAGKSSFFNALLGEERAIVSEFPGTTRDVIRERLTLQGTKSSVTLILHDTAGLREGVDPVEKTGVQRTREIGKEADLLLLILDATGDAEPLLREWKKTGVKGEKTLGILTKCDLISDTRKKEWRKKLQLEFENTDIKDWAETSSVTGVGVHEAGRKIVEYCEKQVFREPGEILLTRFEQLQAIERCLEHIKRAESVEVQELFVADLRQALGALDPLIGRVLPEDILGRIFSQFCIGK